jgi:hypothetical protein
MTKGPGAKDAPPTFTDEERARGQDLFGLGEQESRELLAWVGEHLPRVRRSVYGQHFLHWSLGIALVVGLATHVGGYLLKASVTTEPLGPPTCSMSSVTHCGPGSSWSCSSRSSRR